MNVLQINKYFSLRGGTERYLFDVSELLEHRGHRVIPFAMEDKRNDPSPYARYFSPHMETERVHFGVDGARTALNMIYNGAAKRKLSALIRETSPHVAHIHNIYHQLSSSVLDALRDAEIPAVMTVHDYRLLSPNYTLYHDGMVCERGMRNAWSVVPHRCVKHSYVASALTALETSLTRFRKSYEKTVTRFLMPSQAALDLFERAGWDRKKCVLVPHFLDARRYQPETKPGSDVIYIGRLSPEKGIHVFIEAARRLPGIRFRIIGTGSEETRLRAQADGLQNVTFTGMLQGEALHHAIRSAALVVVPSVCYEVFGYAALESMALGKPVIASRIGALPELVKDGETGSIVSAGNVDEVVDAVRVLMASPATLERMGRAAREAVEKHYSPEVHFGRVMEAYSDAMAMRHPRA